MERRALGVVAIILIGLMALVATAGLDNLPPALHKSIEAANAILVSNRSSFDQDRSRVENALTAEPALFQKEAESWHTRLSRDSAQLDTAAEKLTTAQQLAKANRRADEYDVERDLDQFKSLSQEVLSDTSALRTESERWISAKRSLPDRIRAMGATYQSLEAVDSDPALAPVRKAMLDWPAKRDDLQTRLNGLKDFETQGQKIWDSSAMLRSQAESGGMADSDIETLLSEADQLDTAAREAKEAETADEALAGQLYVSWDKLLLETERGRDPRQRVRLVETRFPDATLAHGTTTSEERWETLSAFRTRDAQENTGMVIERKEAGKYDSEAEKAVQPPAYAYMAPPGQSNNYGSWSGGSWHWLPEYLILSQLLSPPRMIVTAPDYEAYQNARRRGEVFYGNNGGYGQRYTPSPYQPRPYVPRPSTGGTSVPSYSRPPPASPPPSQGYAGSRYQNHGGFAGSQYQSHGSYQASRPAPSPSRSYSRSRGGRR
jgi:hypothetical protein